MVVVSEANTKLLQESFWKLNQRFLAQLEVSIYFVKYTLSIVVG